MLIGSMNSFTPCDSNTWSPEPWPFSSIIRPYWKPEQPPPCTKTRSPLPALFSSDSSSLILDAAVSDTLIMPPLYQEAVDILHSRAHALRSDSQDFPAKSRESGEAAVAGHPRGAARPRARARPPEAAARARGGSRSGVRNG